MQTRLTIPAPPDLLLMCMMALSFLLFSPATIAAQARPTLDDPADVAAFFDGLLAGYMKVDNIPSAVVAVVKDGKVLFAKGYGYADVGKHVPVRADETLFRNASIGKLFTWTAVMQLVEQGKLDLHADVNDYLTTFKIPATYPEPVTLAHLMAHTAGFEDRFIGLFARDAESVVPLGRYLAEHIPERVRPPGAVSSYSNYSAALAGYIVELVSGMPFADYVEQNIMLPLDMNRSTFHEPLPPSFASRMAVGYTYEGGKYRPQGFEFAGNIAPAGSMSVTATDMAAFMIAHLHDGAYGNRRILRAGTAQLMHRQLFTSDPRLPGMAYGFFEGDINGVRTLEHAGGSTRFSSNLVLVPDRDVGLFLSYVRTGVSPAPVFQMVQAFFDRYFPADAAGRAEPGNGLTERLQAVAGHYRPTRHSYTTVEKIWGALLGPEVSVEEDRTLKIVGLRRPFAATYWEEAESFLFRQMDQSGSIVVFQADASGTISGLFADNANLSWYRVPWYGTARTAFLIMGGGSLLCLVWLVTAVVQRRRYGQVAPGARWATRAATAVAAINLAFCLAFGAFFTLMSGDLVFGMPASLPVILVLPLVATLLTLTLVAFIVPAWANAYWSIWRRLHFSTMTVVAVIFVWFYSYWNLLGFRFG